MQPTEFDKSEPSEFGEGQGRFLVVGTPGPIIMAAQECLRGLNYDFIASKGGILFETSISNRKTWLSEFRVDKKTNLLRFYVYLTCDGYRPELRAEIMQLADRVNNLIVVGAVVSDIEAGEVYYRDSINFDTRIPTPHEIRTLMDMAVFSIRFWDTSFEFVRRGVADSKTAFETAEMILQV